MTCHTYFNDSPNIAKPITFFCATDRFVSLNRHLSFIQTDYQYNHNGTQLAVCDSNGYVNIYQRQNTNFVLAHKFQAYNHFNVEMTLSFGS